MRRLVLVLGVVLGAVWLALFFTGHGMGAGYLGVMAMVLIGLGVFGVLRDEA